MTASSESRGWPIMYGVGGWVWSDTLKPIDEYRPCFDCGKSPGDGGIDPCIVGMVQALNNGGIKTIASCCGHGHRPGSILLADGRALTITKDREEWERVEALFPLNICGESIDAVEETT